MTLQLYQDALQKDIDAPKPSSASLTPASPATAKCSGEKHFRQITDYRLPISLDQRISNQGRTLKLYRQILASQETDDGPSRQIICQAGTVSLASATAAS